MMKQIQSELPGHVSYAIIETYTKFPDAAVIGNVVCFHHYFVAPSTHLQFGVYITVILGS